MKSLTEIWNYMPVDHILAAVSTLFCIGFAVWALLFEKEHVDTPEAARQIEYYVEPPRASWRNPAIITLFLIALGLMTLLVIKFVDGSLKTTALF